METIDLNPEELFRKLSAGTEPTPENLVRIVNQMQEYGVRVGLALTLPDGKVVDVLKTLEEKA